MSGFSTIHWIIVCVAGVGLIALYFVPTIIVTLDRHPRRIPIIVLNIVAGWTVVGWIVALIWALMAPEATAAAAPHAIPVDFPADKPGKFKIIGVDRNSGLDEVLYIDAESGSNAKVKAELRGMIVTHVESAEDEIAKAKREAEERRRAEQERREAERRKCEEQERLALEEAERTRQEQIRDDRKRGYLHCPKCEKRMKITGWENVVKCPHCGERVTTKVE